MSYVAPIKDMRFALHELVGLAEVRALPGCEELSDELADAVLEEAARFAEEVLAPLDKTGDREGAKWSNGDVTTPKGWKQAYEQFRAGGWTGLEGEPHFGGQGLPHALATAVNEIWGAANMAFKLCPMLTVGAVEAIATVGTDAQKQLYLRKMIDGTWSGTMNLTEPQAGSDLAQVRTKAVPQADGSYRVFGQKIFITYGEHDMTENIVHLVLARIEGAPDGVKGISLFIVPKFVPDANGNPGARNDVKCVSIEHKLGIHASPTCVMSYGEHEGATGFLIGEANRGLEYMFIMMNAARLGVGLEGVSICERAYQRALQWARERVQGRPLGVQAKTAMPIVHHPDVKRMLLTIKAYSEATRALAYYAAATLDKAERHPDATEKRKHQAAVDFLIPIVKGWSTEIGIECASLGVQIHGGMGFIEETGAAQILRDARITTIYEGTTGIQANDLVGRKVGRENGQTALAFIAQMQRDMAALDTSDAQVRAVRDALVNALGAMKNATEWIVTVFPSAPDQAAAGSVAYLKLCGTVIGGWLMAKAAAICAAKLKSDDADTPFYASKLKTARFYADYLLPQAQSLAQVIVNGAKSVVDMEEALF